MTMRFGALQCIRCTQMGHLSYQCKKPIVDLLPVEKPEEPKPTDAELDRDLYDEQVWY